MNDPAADVFNVSNAYFWTFSGVEVVGGRTQLLIGTNNTDQTTVTIRDAARPAAAAVRKCCSALLLAARTLLNATVQPRVALRGGMQERSRAACGPRREEQNGGVESTRGTTPAGLRGSLGRRDRAAAALAPQPRLVLHAAHRARVQDRGLQPGALSQRNPHRQPFAVPYSAPRCERALSAAEAPQYDEDPSVAAMAARELCDLTLRVLL